MLVYCGIDEAGYGPMLGPLVVSAATFILPDHRPENGPPDLWSVLSRCVTREPAKAESKRWGTRIVVNDSKRLKLSADGRRHPLHHLELGVLAFELAGGGRLPATMVAPPAPACPGRISDQTVSAEVFLCDRDLLCRLAPELAHDLGPCPWYAGDDLPLPQAGHDPGMLRVTAARLARGLADGGLSGVTLDAEVITEPRYNHLVDRMRSKATASFSIVMRLVDRVLRRWPDAHPRIIVDRQGARSFYREPLAMSYPQFEVRIVAESDGLSRYTLVDPARRGRPVVTISFIEKAEERHFPVALASMTAKYARELMMIRFNRWAATICPEIKPTAGYVQDARRFLDEFRPAARLAGLDLTPLIRVR